MKTFTNKLNILFLCLLFTTALHSTGATYYVATTGNDGNAGSLAQPWQTVQYAADAIAAGDTVFIRGGIYNEQVTLTIGGNAVDGYVVFSAYQNETVNMDGTGVSTGNNGFIIQASYIKVIALTVRNWASTCIWVQGPVGFIELSYCKAHDAAGCISFTNGVHDFALYNCEMYNFLSYGFDATSDQGEPDSYNGVINDCYSHDGDPQQNCDGFGFGHSIHRNIEFNRCVVHNVYDGFDLTGHNMNLNQCLAYDCGNGAYKLWSDSIYLTNCIGYGSLISNLELDGDMTANPTYNPKTIVLRNCTFFDAGSFNILVFNPNWGDSIKVYNCIIAGGDNIGITFGDENFSTYIGDYNVFQNDNPGRYFSSPLTDINIDDMQSGAWTTLSGQDAHSITVNSSATIFTDTILPNLHLIAGSSAIDNGTSASAPAIDYDGCPRPNNAVYDIGAFEYPPCPLGTEEISQQAGDNYLLHNFPNPFSDLTKIGFFMDKETHVDLWIYDPLGKLLLNPVNKILPAGNYDYNFSASLLPAGIYYARLSTDEHIEVVKMMVIH